MRRKRFLIILSVGIILSSLLSIYLVYNLQGNARVINYTGLVRGATQRLIKQELNHQPNDKLIKILDDIISELQGRSGAHDIAYLADHDFQTNMIQMERDWERLKQEIYIVRDGGKSTTLYQYSEDFFNLADKAVLSAEKFSESKVSSTENALIILNLSFVLLIIFIYMYDAKQDILQRKLELAQEDNQRKSERLIKLAEDLKAPMNDISELLYISDLETYDLLFLNKAGIESFKVEKIKGQKCYKILQGRDEPCEFCTNPYLKEGENYTWEFKNPVTGRHYLLKDRLIEWEGKLARMEIAFDTTKSEEEKIKLRFTLDAEKIITDCVDILYRDSDIEKATMSVLEKLGSFLSADRSYIVYIRDGLMYNDYEWCEEHILSQKNCLQELPLSIIERWIPYFTNKECIVVKDLEEIKSTSPEEYQILHNQSITSLVVAPLEQNGELIGYLGVDNPPPDKIMNIASLLQTLCYFISLAWQHSKTQEQLAKLSYIDKLTSFYNRNRFIEDSQVLTKIDISIGIVYLDVNGLKDVNDKYGHEMGDKLLIECARRMKLVFHYSDFYRLGGDEFVIICREIKEDVFRKKIIELKGEFRKKPTCQVAIGSYWASTIDDIGEIIKNADAEMYEDKKDFYRKNSVSQRYRHHSDEMLHLRKPEVLEREIRNNRFLVYLQPQISFSDRSIVGAEALIRYLDNSNSLISPNNFLPILEASELLSKIDFYVFESICKKLRNWITKDIPIVPISINFSEESLKIPEFVNCLVSTCQYYHVSTKYIKIEITERVHDEKHFDVKKIISDLRAVGFAVAIDDFGTENANLALLSEVEFDILKLDKSLINNIVSNSRTKVIMEYITGICHKLNIYMVAEGIETEEQFFTLLQCRVEIAQGYLFSKPISIDEFENKYLIKSHQLI
ncbi:EAL domain-containing protein [Clostridioides sp. ES-S-0171-01]|nr:EAL domain-containing protein [Clostridioides sp. ES-S-0171-01]MCC0686510.1 EAL domain-containing protein [Clostridioides sp. ES-S-0056-01]MCC0713969.1 EAL domain-containing protein [Clostridioides sp. ES-S-0077-01]UDN55097.1 EAL domain-containing protein [Clostridioides sp. ES-S-0054-01]